MQVIQDHLRALSLGSPQQRLNLTLFPLQCDKAADSGYATLRAAVAAGDVSITEVSAAATFPRWRWPIAANARC